MTEMPSITIDEYNKLEKSGVMEKMKKLIEERIIRIPSSMEFSKAFAPSPISFFWPAFQNRNQQIKGFYQEAIMQQQSIEQETAQMKKLLSAEVYNLWLDGKITKQEAFATIQVGVDPAGKEVGSTCVTWTQVRHDNSGVNSATYPKKVIETVRSQAISEAAQQSGMHLKANQDCDKLRRALNVIEYYYEQLKMKLLYDNMFLSGFWIPSEDTAYLYLTLTESMSEETVSFIVEINEGYIVQSEPGYYRNLVHPVDKTLLEFGKRNPSPAELSLAGSYQRSEADGTDA